MNNNATMSVEAFAQISAPFGERPIGILMPDGRIRGVEAVHMATKDGRTCIVLAPGPQNVADTVDTIREIF